MLRLKAGAEDGAVSDLILDAKNILFFFGKGFPGPCVFFGPSSLDECG